MSIDAATAASLKRIGERVLIRTLLRGFLHATKVGRYKTITLGTGHSAHYANYANHTQYPQYSTTEPTQNVNPSSSLHIQ